MRGKSSVAHLDRPQDGGQLLVLEEKAVRSHARKFMRDAGPTQGRLCADVFAKIN